MHKINDTCNIVEVEKSASLNVLLHSLLWAMAIYHLPSFSLTQNPQFYRKFPTTKKHFSLSSPVSESSSDLHPHIPALNIWDPVEKYKGGTLHLIVGRNTSDSVVLSNLSKLHLPEIYSNGWHLDDDEDLIVVREKGM